MVCRCTMQLSNALILSLLCFTKCLLTSAEKVRIRYISTEHPSVTYYNTKYLRYANLTSQRYGRNNPFYYVGYHMDIVYEISNNWTVSFYFYEFLSNRYKTSFIEMHWKICDLIHKDKWFGAPLKQGPFDRPCPYPPGPYNAYNMTIAVSLIPKNFPFTKGRIYCNITGTSNNDVIASGYINMDIKTYTRHNN